MMGNVGTSREIVGYIHICIGKHWDILGLQKNIIGYNRSIPMEHIGIF